MSRVLPHQSLRILDANFNRSREGIRVCEDICRFVIHNPESATRLRAIRHGITRVYKTFSLSDLLKSRNTAEDEGKKFDASERKRTGWRDLYHANMQRSKESLRVLEEVLKLSDPGKAGAIKRLRFKLYDREKNDSPRLQTVHHR